MNIPVGEPPFCIYRNFVLRKISKTHFHVNFKKTKKGKKQPKSTGGEIKVVQKHCTLPR